MTDDAKRLEEIAKRCDAATSGPWEQLDAEEVRAYPPDPHCKECEADGVPVADFCFARDFSGEEQAKANIAFIANSRADVPFLLSLVRQLDEELSFERRQREELTRNLDVLMAQLAASQKACDELGKLVYEKAVDSGGKAR